MYPNPQEAFPRPPRPSLEHYKTLAKDLEKARADSKMLAALSGAFQHGGVMTDLESLTELNRTYIRCVAEADTRRFAEILADDFLNSNPDGTLVDKAAFLRQIERIGTFASIDLEDVRIRIEGSVALIHAATRFTFADGRSGHGRYTDVWAKRGNQWIAVSAHVTRITM